MKKPGTALRATAAFTLLNIPLFLTLVVVYYAAGGMEANWWIRGIVALAFAVSEFSIVATTIAPPLYDWIKSEETVNDNEKPSWEKK